MKHIFIVLVILSMWSCSNDSPSAATTKDTSVQKQEPKTVAQDNKQPATQQVAQAPPAATATNTAKKDEKPIIGTVPATKKEVSKEGGFTLVPTDASASSGGVACVDITTKSFKDIMSMQYTMQWDPKVATFKGVKDINLPHLGKNNYGMHILDQGLMTFVWIENSLQGVTLTDNTSIYKMCFELKGEKGASSFFKITDKPTRIEALNGKEDLVKLSSTESTITIQ